MTTPAPLCVHALRSDGDPHLLLAMHRLRARVFKNRLGWGVSVFDGLEIDQFDDADPHYLLLLGADRQLLGCTRMLPGTGPTMLADVFPQLADTAPPADPASWETSRFCIDTAACEEAGLPWTERGVSVATHALLAGMLEWCAGRDIDRVTTVTNVPVERILHAAHCPAHRLGAPRRIDDEDTVAIVIDVAPGHTDALLQAAALTAPVLHPNETEFGFRPEPLQFGPA